MQKLFVDHPTESALINEAGVHTQEKVDCKEERHLQARKAAASEELTPFLDNHTVYLLGCWKLERNLQRGPTVPEVE